MKRKKNVFRTRSNEWRKRKSAGNTPERRSLGAKGGWSKGVKEKEGDSELTASRRDHMAIRKTAAERELTTQKPRY